MSGTEERQGWLMRVLATGDRRDAGRVLVSMFRAADRVGVEALVHRAADSLDPTGEGALR